MIVPSRRLLLASAAIALPLAAVGGMFPAASAVCAVGLAVCGVVAAVDAVAGARRLALVTLRLPPFVRLTKDAAATLPLRVENAGSARQVRIGVNFPDGVESTEAVRDVELPAGASAIDWPCLGRERGDHALEQVYLEGASPLGLWLAREERRVEFSFRVYPNLRRKANAALFLRTSNVGMKVQRQVGKGREFENLRHYLPGDSFEDIHWKATAKRSFPAVKLYRVEHAQEVYAVVDASRLSAREGILESFVDAALHLALVAERQGDRFGLVTFSNSTHQFVRARSGADHFRLCREAIYNLHAKRVNPDFRDVITSLQSQLRRRALLVFFTSLDDALLAENFERDIGLLARRHVVLVNVRQTAALRPLYAGSPPEDVEGVYEGLAGQMLWNRLRALEVALRNRGVRLSLTDPERILEQVAAGYLEVKRRQLL